MTQPATLAEEFARALWHAMPTRRTIRSASWRVWTVGSFTWEYVMANEIEIESATVKRTARAIAAQEAYDLEIRRMRFIEAAQSAKNDLLNAMGWMNDATVHALSNQQADEIKQLRADAVRIADRLKAMGNAADDVDEVEA